MIVNPSERGWDIIFQQAHALLAGQLALQWQRKERPLRWTETLAAIIDHDDGQRGWRKGAHLTEAGAPMDFTMLEFDLNQARNVVDNARYRSRWIALLTSMHTSTLYERLRGRDKETDIFLDEQWNYQHKLRRSLQIKKQEAESAYSLLFLCDACSLVLCKNEVPAGGRKLELGKGPTGHSHFIYAKDEITLSVDPWPFEGTKFQLTTEVFHLDQLNYQNDQELHQALGCAEVRTKSWQFHK